MLTSDHPPPARPPGPIESIARQMAEKLGLADAYTEATQTGDFVAKYSMVELTSPSSLNCGSCESSMLARKLILPPLFPRKSIAYSNASRSDALSIKVAVDSGSGSGELVLAVIMLSVDKLANSFQRAFPPCLAAKPQKRCSLPSLPHPCPQPCGLSVCPYARMLV